MKDDFEKLLVAKKYIAILKDEIGQLNGNVAELHAEIKGLRFDLSQKKKLSPAEKLTMRTNEEVVRLTAKNKALMADLKACKTDKERLIMKLNND